MPKISRVRLHSIGHPNARFEEMTLDFRDGAGRAEHSTYWAENGTGKTSFLNLLFSHVRPGKREFLGKAKALEDYLIAGDTGLIAVEWELDGSSSEDLFGAVPRLVTGSYYELKPSPEAEGSQLRRVHFMYRALSGVDALTLEQIPIHATANGSRRKRTVAGFEAELEELRRSYPAAEVATTDAVGKWNEYLENAGIDAELFALMLRMNGGEGTAAEAFKFQDEREFVDFVLGLVTRPDFGEKVAHTLAAYRSEVVDRLEDRRLERDFVAELRGALEPLAACAAEREQIRVQAADLVGTTEALIAGANAKVASAKADEADAYKEMEAERTRAHGLDRSAERLSQRTVGIAVAVAESRLEAALASQRDVEVQHALAERDHALWSSATLVAEIIRQEAIAHDTLAELSRAKDEHAPLLADSAEAAGSYAAAIRFACERLNDQIRQSGEMEQECTERKDGLLLDAKNAAVRAGKERSAAFAARDRADAAEKELRHLVAEGATLEGEALGSAEARVTEEKAAAVERASVTNRRLSDLTAARPALVAKQHATRDAVGVVDRALGVEEDKLRRAEESRRALAGDDWLGRVLEQDTVDPEQVNLEILRNLRGTDARIQDSLFEERRVTAEDASVVRVLDETGLLPPSNDVLAVVRIIRDARFQAWAGWEYISENLPRGLPSREFIRRMPHAAQGVVVRQQDCGAVTALLNTSRVELAGPVTVVSHDDLDGSVKGIVVGPSTDAHFDQDAGRLERDRRQSRLDSASDRIQHIERELTDLRSIAGRIDAFLREYPDGWFADQHAAIKQLRSDVERLRADDVQAQDAITRHDQDVTEARRDLEAANEDLGTWRHRAALLETFCRQFGEDPDQFTREAMARESAAREAEREAEAANEAADAAQNEAVEYRLQKERDSEQLAGLKFRLIGVKYLDESDRRSVQGDIETLQARYDQLSGLREKTINETGLGAKHAAAEDAIRVARRNLDLKFQSQKNVQISEADVRIVLDTLGGDHSQVPRHEIDALKELQSRAGSRGNAGRRVADSRTARQNAQDAFATTEGAIPAVLGEGDVPTDADEAESVMLRMSDEVAKHRQTADEARSNAKVAQELVSLMATEAKSIGRELESVRTLRSTMAPHLLGSIPVVKPTIDIRDAEHVHDVRTQIGQAADRIADAVTKLDNRSDARAAKVRSVLTDERYVAILKGREQSKEGATIHDITRDLLQHAPRELEGAAADRCERLTVRTSILQHIIETHEAKRETIVIGALREAEEGLSMLTAVNNAARLPASTGMFADVKFLTIGFRPPTDEAERRSRVATEIDALLKEQVLPTGQKIGQRLVRALGGRFTARVQVPNPLRGPQEITVVELAKKSGGEHLTCTIMMHCILTKLRARHRRSAVNGSSTLILDNPFGTSSRVLFLDLQREVAAANHVQLLYTTAIKDWDAVASLPNLNRVRPAGITTDGSRVILERAGTDTGLTAARLSRDVIAVAVEPITA